MLASQRVGHNHLVFTDASSGELPDDPGDGGSVSSEDDMHSASLICAAVSPLAPAMVMPRAVRRLNGETNRFPGCCRKCLYIARANSLLSSAGVRGCASPPLGDSVFVPNKSRNQTPTPAMCPPGRRLTVMV